MNFRVCVSSIFRPVCTHPCMFMLADNVEGYGYVYLSRCVLFMCIYICDLCVSVFYMCLCLHVFYFTYIFV